MTDRLLNEFNGEPIMGRAGRKRKSGTREANGRIKRAPRAISYDRGTNTTQAKHSVYGTDGSDAIGRAYVAGLLGEDGLNLRNAGRAIFHAYWPMFGVGAERSCLGDQSGGGMIHDPIDMDERQRMIDRERRLTETLAMIDALDKTLRTRRAFDQLCININPDCGPSFLDSIIWHKTRGKQPPVEHEQSLALAIKALTLIAT